MAIPMIISAVLAPHIVAAATTFTGAATAGIAATAGAVSGAVGSGIMYLKNIENEKKHTEQMKSLESSLKETQASVAALITRHEESIQKLIYENNRMLERLMTNNEMFSHQTTNIPLLTQGVPHLRSFDSNNMPTHITEGHYEHDNLNIPLAESSNARRNNRLPIASFYKKTVIFNQYTTQKAELEDDESLNQEDYYSTRTRESFSSSTVCNDSLSRNSSKNSFRTISLEE